MPFAVLANADHARIVRDTLAAVGTSTLATAWRVSDRAMSDARLALLPAVDLLLHDVEEIDSAVDRAHAERQTIPQPAPVFDRGS